MAVTLFRTDKEIEEIYNTYVNMLYRLCYSYMKNPADAEDAVQNTFLKLIRFCPKFKSIEHQKAWLITVASNVCKDELKNMWKKTSHFDELSNTQPFVEIGKSDIFEAVMQLPNKYKTVVYLYYYEEYTSAEIAKMIKKNHSTVRNYLSEARKLLQKHLGGKGD
ncbi:RNA polymerase sigma factor [Clostridia bacterium]|nr:RNA polymerase sigma factor [Clostridia bacterium]